MLIRSLLPSDRSSVVEILDSNASGPQHSPFRPEEVACAVELLDAILAPSRADVEDYEGRVITDDQGRVVSYACFGITPMTDATYDLYWLATHADARGRGVQHALSLRDVGPTFQQVAGHARRHARRSGERRRRGRDAKV